MNKRSVDERRLLRERRLVRAPRDRYYRPHRKLRGWRAVDREFNEILLDLTSMFSYTADMHYASLMNHRFEGIVSSMDAKMHEDGTLPEGINFVVGRGPSPELFIMDELTTSTGTNEEVNDDVLPRRELP